MLEEELGHIYISAGGGVDGLAARRSARDHCSRGMSRTVICDDHNVGFVETKNIGDVRGLLE